MKRRQFFREALGETVRSAYKGFDSLRETFSGVSDTLQNAMDGTGAASGEFFDSYELSYSLTLAYPREMFEQMARDQGMPYDGIETIELARELNRRGVI